VSLQYFINILLLDVHLSMFSATQHGARGRGARWPDSGSFTEYGQRVLRLLPLRLRARKIRTRSAQGRRIDRCADSFSGGLAAG
jgi:hypothetical protein